MPVGAITNQPVSTVADALTSAAIPTPAKQKPTEAFGFVVARHDKVLEYQFSVARWIMASLLVLNGGGMLAILNAADKLPQAIRGGSWFLAGAAAAVLSGSVAWLNCNLITAAADCRLNWHELDYQESSTADALEKWALRTGIVAVILSIASLALFVGGVVAIKSAFSA